MNTLKKLKKAFLKAFPSHSVIKILVSVLKRRKSTRKKAEKLNYRIFTQIPSLIISVYFQTKKF